MPKTQFSGYMSPNIVIVPTLSFSDSPPAKKQKLVDSQTKENVKNSDTGNKSVQSLNIPKIPVNTCSNAVFELNSKLVLPTSSQETISRPSIVPINTDVDKKSVRQTATLNIDKVIISQPLEASKIPINNSTSWDPKNEILKTSRRLVVPLGPYTSQTVTSNTYQEAISKTVEASQIVVKNPTSWNYENEIEKTLMSQVVPLGTYANKNITSQIANSNTNQVAIQKLPEVSKIVIKNSTSWDSKNAIKEAPRQPVVHPGANVNKNSASQKAALNTSQVAISKSSEVPKIVTKNSESLDYKSGIKNNTSWASSYLQSIGQHYESPIKLNLSYRNKIVQKTVMENKCDLLKLNLLSRSEVHKNEEKKICPLQIQPSSTVDFRPRKDLKPSLTQSFCAKNIRCPSEDNNTNKPSKYIWAESENSPEKILTNNENEERSDTIKTKYCTKLYKVPPRSSSPISYTVKDKVPVHTKKDETNKYVNEGNGQRKSHINLFSSEKKNVQQRESSTEKKCDSIKKVHKTDSSLENKSDPIKINLLSRSEAHTYTENKINPSCLQIQSSAAVDFIPRVDLKPSLTESSYAKNTPHPPEDNNTNKPSKYIQIEPENSHEKILINNKSKEKSAIIKTKYPTKLHKVCLRSTSPISRTLKDKVPVPTKKDKTNEYVSKKNRQRNSHTNLSKSRKNIVQQTETSTEKKCDSNKKLHNTNSSTKDKSDPIEIDLISSSKIHKYEENKISPSCLQIRPSSVIDFVHGIDLKPSPTQLSCAKNIPLPTEDNNTIKCSKYIRIEPENSHEKILINNKSIEGFDIIKTKYPNLHKVRPRATSPTSHTVKDKVSVLTKKDINKYAKKENRDRKTSIIKSTVKTTHSSHKSKTTKNTNEHSNKLSESKKQKFKSKSRLTDKKCETVGSKVKTKLVTSSIPVQSTTNEKDMPEKNTTSDVHSKNDNNNIIKTQSINPERLQRKRVRVSLEKEEIDDSATKKLNSIKSVIQVTDKFPVKHPRIRAPESDDSDDDQSSDFDLRSKLSRINYKQNTKKSRPQNEFQSQNLPDRENLVITLNAHNQNVEDLNTKTPSPGPSTRKTKVQKIKKIQLVINVVCQKPDDNSSSSSSDDVDSSDGTRDNYSLHNIDFSFLDDFNVDEIVNSLKHSPKRDNIPQDTKRTAQIHNISSAKKSRMSANEYAQSIIIKNEIKTEPAINKIPLPDTHENYNCEITTETSVANKISRDMDQRTTNWKSFNNVSLIKLQDTHIENQTIHEDIIKNIKQEKPADEDIINFNNSLMHEDKFENSMQKVINDNVYETAKCLINSVSQNIEVNTLYSQTFVKTEDVSESNITIKHENNFKTLTETLLEDVMESKNKIEIIDLTVSTLNTVKSANQPKALCRKKILEDNNSSKSHIKQENSNIFTITLVEDVTKIETIDLTVDTINKLVEPTIQPRLPLENILEENEYSKSHIKLNNNSEILNDIHTEDVTDIVIKKEITDLSFDKESEQKETTDQSIVHPLENILEKNKTLGIKMHEDNNNDISISNNEEVTIQKENVSIQKENKVEENVDEKIVQASVQSAEATENINNKSPNNGSADTRIVQLSTLSNTDKTVATNIEQRIFDYLHMNISVTSLIHKGRFSKVFKCKDTNGQNYAIKILTNDTHRQPLGIQKGKMLMDIQKDIPKDNLNVVYLINGFGLDRNWCFLMEYYPKNLQQALNRRDKPFNIDQVQDLARQLVAAVMVLRNNDVVHSDIKPPHILLNASNTKLKLCGFDSSYYSKSVNVLPNIGTVCYRAPEIIMGYSAGFSIDVWSTALIIYEMATGEKLFKALYNNGVLYKQMCTLGNLPLDMVNASPFAVNHYVGNTFMRRVGFMGQNAVPIPKFHKTNRIYGSLFSTYNKFWSSTRTKGRRVEDLTKLRSLHILLEQMLVLDPRRRLAIEFVYADPFIYNRFS